MIADRLQRQALFAEPDGLGNIGLGEASATHAYAVAVEVFADGLAGDLEFAGKLVDSAAGPVPSDQPCHVIRRQPSL
ncbi:hypothetical protein [Flindersiella endophytica]